MIIAENEARLAYTYAWWLTGSERDAQTAVLAAVDRPEVPGADDELRLEILLRRVRAAATSVPTMCPASELSLLHDGIGLTLDSAAGLAMVDSREARTELAHGRLEALDDGVNVEIVEPERLGGLAVGNPADVAAARQNPKLEQLRRQIMSGRDEMVLISPVEAPAALLEAVAARRQEEEELRGPRWTGAHGITDVTDETPDTLLSPLVTDEPADSTLAPDEDDAADPERGEHQGADPGPAEHEGADADPENADPEEQHDAGITQPVDTDADGATADAAAASDAANAETAGAADAIPADAIPADATEAEAAGAAVDETGDGTHVSAGRTTTTAVEPLTSATGVDDAEEVDLSDQVAGEPPPLGVPRAGRSSLIWLAVGLAVVVAMIVLITGQSNDADFLADDAQTDDPTLVVPDEPTLPDATASAETATDEALPDAVATPDSATGSELPPIDPAVSPSPSAVATSEPAGPAPTEALVDPPVEPRGLQLVATGVAVGLGADPVDDNPSATPFDPVSFVVTYSGAAEGDALVANWTVDGVQFAVERVDLLPGERSSRFSQQVPQDGWPLGQHVLALTIPGQPEVLGEVRFVVVPENAL